MKPIVYLFISLILAGFCSQGMAQDAPEYKIEKLRENLYELWYDTEGYPVKVIALTGPDGLLIVDAGERDAGENLLKALKNLSPDEPSYVIFSHSHIEHLGGIFAFTTMPVIIGHENLREKLRQGSYLFDEFDDHTLPQIQFTDSLTLYFNGEEIRLRAFTGAHDNSDIVVWFRKSKVVFVGGLCNGHHFPSVDGKGGDVTKYPGTVARIISYLPLDVTIIPGHGEDVTMADLKGYHRMLVSTSELVRQQLAAGKTAEDMKKEDLLKDYSSYEIVYVSKDDWIDYLVKGYSPKPAGKEPLKKKNLFEPMYWALKEKGADKVQEAFLDLKSNHQEEYIFDQYQVLYIGYKLHLAGKYGDAMVFYQLALDEFPGGDYDGLVYYLKGTTCLKTGDRARAKEEFQKALGANHPEPRAEEKLRQLQ
jgi:glyoxylase-like metal-dependent hydrolase (beta-lactamase superfamily II)